MNIFEMKLELTNSCSHWIPYLLVARTTLAVLHNYHVLYLLGYSIYLQLTLKKCQNPSFEVHTLLWAYKSSENMSFLVSPPFRYLLCANISSNTLPTMYQSHIAFSLESYASNLSKAGKFEHERHYLCPLQDATFRHK